MKFVLKEDWTYENNFLGKLIKKTLYTKGTIFEPDETGMYEIVDPYGLVNKMQIEQMRNFPFMEEIIEPQSEFEIVIEEVPEDDDNLVKNWRIQLEVKTTRKKLKEIQKIIEEYIKPIL